MRGVLEPLPHHGQCSVGRDGAVDTYLHTGALEGPRGLDRYQWSSARVREDQEPKGAVNEINMFQNKVAVIETKLFQKKVAVNETKMFQKKV